jgi:acetyl-CoA C-acetyltransferase/acetyl-CoA acyltransferase
MKGWVMDVYIYEALRTPRGKARPDGGLAQLRPGDLIHQLTAALCQRQGFDPQSASALILGCVGQIGAQGGHIALVAKLIAGLAEQASAITINNYCVSGLSAIGMAYDRLRSRPGTQPVFAGGVEMMSAVPFMADQASFYTDTNLPPALRYVQVAAAADRLAHISNISRAAMDQLASQSHARALAAEDDPVLIASRIPVNKPDGTIALAREETPRENMTVERLAAMPAAFGGLTAQYAQALETPAFEPLMTIAHAPPVCDGAGLALLGLDRDQARARIVAIAEIGGNARDSLTAGFAAMDQVLAQAGLSLGDMDRIEFMEAFAVTIALFLRDYKVDPARVNVGGGHMAKGHPMGATGAILLSSLLDSLDHAQGRYGLVVAAGASGIGAAMVVERLA